MGTAQGVEVAHALLVRQIQAHAVAQPALGNRSGDGLEFGPDPKQLPPEILQRGRAAHLRGHRHDQRRRVRHVRLPQVRHVLHGVAGVAEHGQAEEVEILGERAVEDTAGEAARKGLQQPVRALGAAFLADDAHRQVARGVEQFLRRVGAHEPRHLAALSRMRARFGIGVGADCFETF